jgi:hypothetical protein
MESGMKPQRIQLSRKKGWKMPANTVKVDRSTPFGNPFAIAPATEHGKETRKGWMCGAIFTAFYTDKREAAEMAVKAFSEWIEHPANAKLLSAVKHGLRGKNLGCWCPVGSPCHADVLLEIANR